MNEELIEIIKKSGLSPEDRAEWENMVSAMPEDASGALLETIKGGAMDISQMNDFYQRKKQAVSIMKEDKAKGQEMLDGIFREEAEIINKL